jgi:hypothetical protein
MDRLILRPFYHPLVVVMILSMAGLGCWYLAQSVYALCSESEIQFETPGSVGAQVSRQMINEDYVSDWPSFLGQVVWCSLFAAACLMCLVHLRLAVIGRSHPSLQERGVGLMTDANLDEVREWVGSSRMVLARLRGVWS